MTPGAPGLTACLIVRDEEEFLPGCLASLRACVAVTEICVLDTGSVDATVQIARQAGARVEEWPWRDDFALAKNRAVAMANTRWILSIDADERLRADAAALKSALRGLDEQECDVVAVILDDVRNGHSMGTAPVQRLLRPQMAHFVGRVHEVPARRDGRAVRLGSLPASALSLVHVGYDVPSRDSRRHRRNLDLADREVTDARRSGARARIASALVNRGRAKVASAGAAEAGVSDWLEARSYAVPDAFNRWAGELAVSALAEAGRGHETGPLLAALTGEGSDGAQLAWLAAKVFRHAGRRAEELACLCRAEGRVTAMGERPTDEDTLALRLNAELELGRYDEAVRTAARLAGGYVRTDALRTLCALTDALGHDACEQGARLLCEATRPGRGAEVRAALVAQQESAHGLADAFDRLFSRRMD